MLKINNKTINIGGSNRVDFGDIVFELEFTEQTTYKFKLLANYHYDLNINWGDGSKEKKVYFDAAHGSTLDHVYQTGTYIVRIKGVCETLDFFVDRNEPDNLINILSFGKNEIKYLTFNNCQKLITLPNENKHFTDMIDMSKMFLDCKSLTTIPQFDTSNVTNMYEMFKHCESLTTIPLLDTSNVTDMVEMFSYCSSLITIPQLNTSNVINMVRMFNECSSLTSIPQLDTSNITDMDYMFENTTNLTCLSNIDTTAITSDQVGVFNGCTSLTTPDATTRDNLMTVVGKGTWTNPGTCA